MSFRISGRLAAFLVAVALAAGQAGPEVVSVKAFTAATKAGTSASPVDIGQTMHMMTVQFPTAAGSVSGFAVRIEASFDGALWFPITADVTSAPRVGNATYAVAVGYAPWPRVRVRLVTPAAGHPMTVYYHGSRTPVVSVIQQESDRFLM